MKTTTASEKVSLPTPPEATDTLEPRSLRARSERMAVSTLGGGVYEVETESENVYLVDLQGGRCTCPDHVMRRTRCKHLRRVAIEINEGRVPPPGRKRGVCANCGTSFFAPEHEDKPHLCPNCDLEPGDAVVDRETGDLLVVIQVTNDRADEIEIPDRDSTVADYPTNHNYPGSDPVVELIYPLPRGITPASVKPSHVRRYSFPRSRLRTRFNATDDEQATLNEFAVESE